MSTRRFLEVEVKFAVSETTPRPDLTKIPGVTETAQAKQHNLSAIYYDTKDLRLTRSKITLRRRSGGKDEGWHIKLPGSAGRIEIHAELGEPIDGEFQVPLELLEQVRALVRRHPLIPIAQVDNERTETLLHDDKNVVLAEFCDDHVTAWSLLPGGERTHWREWEIELAEAAVNNERGAELLGGATSQFISAGARVSKSPSKLVAALGESIDTAPLPPQVAELDEDSPAFAVIQALKANRDKLIEYDPRVRRDEWDSVHQMRVATRELRSHMQTFEGILGGEEFERIEDELKLLAGMLGVARDAEVVEERFHDLLDAEDSGVLDEATREHLRDDMGQEYRRAHRRVVATLNSDRYLTLLDSLDNLLANPPVLSGAIDEISDSTADDENAEDSATSEETEETPTVAATPVTAVDAGEQADEHPGEPGTVSPTISETPLTPAGDVEEILSEHLDGAYRKLMKRHARAVDNWDNKDLTLHQREEYFHDMRKAAKKLRYSAEAVGAATELKTKRLYKACKDLQSSLGDFQDSVTSRDFLLKKAQQARKRHEDTFGYGVLYQRERQIGLRALDDYSAGVKDIRAAYERLANSRKSKKKHGKKKK
ncbi:CHAD domain-containing protein [Corynebacterium halotolerans]|uniref:CYTH and CHAD domain-containing protein n=1 Tax=Corynebacterium halotolerans TaxID=225326 RepID=UPI003CF7AABF